MKNSRNMLRFLTRFAQDERGVSAVEFALTVPILLMSLLGVVDLGNVVYKRADMDSALRAGIQYFMNGGADLTVAQQIVTDSWTTKPQGVIVVADKVCYCGTVANSCNSLCGDGSVPTAYSRLQAMATFPGILISDNYYSQQTVRVR